MCAAVAWRSADHFASVEPVALVRVLNQLPERNVRRREPAAGLKARCSLDSFPKPLLTLIHNSRMRTQFLTLLLLATAPVAFAQTASPHDHLAREIYAELVNIDTSSKAGTTRAAQAMAKRLLDAGFPAADVQVLGAAPDEHNLVARLRGTGANKPMWNGHATSWWHGLGNPFGGGPILGSFPRGLSSVPFTWNYLGRTLPM